MVENSQRILSTWRHLWPRSCLPSDPHTMARYHISLVSTSPDTSYLFRDSSSKTNQHFLDSKESYSPQVKSLQKLFNFLIYILCFSTNKMFSCFRFYFLWFWILHICRCSRRICLLMPLMRDSYCSLGKQFTNLNSRDLSSSSQSSKTWRRCHT